MGLRPRFDRVDAADLSRIPRRVSSNNFPTKDRNNSANISQDAAHRVSSKTLINLINGEKEALCLSLLRVIKLWRQDVRLFALEYDIPGDRDETLMNLDL